MKKEEEPKIIRASDSPYDDTEPISTGLPQVDRLTGIGGIPRRRITEILGQWGVGKTTLCLFLIREAQKDGVECVWADVERSWKNKYAKSFGVDTDALGLIQTDLAEETLDLVQNHARENEGCLYVVDSVGGLHSRFEAEKEAGEKTIGAQSNAVSVFCRKMTPIIANHNHALVFINHEFMPMGANAFQPSGGAKLAYHKSLSLRLTKAYGGAEPLSKLKGMRVEIEIKKNKLASTVAQKCIADMIYGHGFIPLNDQFEDELEKGIITKTGNTFFREGVKLGVGKIRASEALKGPVSI